MPKIIKENFPKTQIYILTAYQRKYSVAEVAGRIGIQDPCYFHHVFKKYYNTTPGQFVGLQNKFLLRLEN
jgi:AraC-like DNA-binding protein